MKLNKILFISFILSSFCTYAESLPPLPGDPHLYEERPASISCVIDAAKKYGVPANVLLALSSVESGKNGQIVRNKDGSLDIGHFQINTSHWSGNGFDGIAGINLRDVALRGCYNAELAAWLLKKRLTENPGADYWVKVANYHSKTKKFNDIYKAKVIPYAIAWGKWLERNGQYAVTYK